jgi:hypothetical protein
MDRGSNSRFVVTGHLDSVARCVASFLTDQARITPVEAKNQQLKTNKMDKISSIRNRQVASSNLALGSTFPFLNQGLANFLFLRPEIRCKVVASSLKFSLVFFR